GITTYIWLLSNNKTANRKGKVQLIDSSKLFRKLRKNLGNKNCELAPTHIQEILKAYQSLQDGKEAGSELNVKVFNNADFGYYKVSIERPKRLKAQFTVERIADLRYDKSLRDAMIHLQEQYGDAVYDNLQVHAKEIKKWAESDDWNLNSKQVNTLLKSAI